MSNKKLAVFVEGQTELIFVRKLIEEIAGAHNVDFLEQRLWSKQLLFLSSNENENAKYNVLIVDCGSDGTVLTTLLDQYATLKQEGYSGVIGLRDLHPIPIGDIGEVQSDIDNVLPSSDLPCRVVIAVMEVEAWFVAENKHFSALDPNLTRGLILNNLAFDIESGNPESIPVPAKFLDEAYKLVGMAYTKKKWQVDTTVSVLDYGDLYMLHPENIASLAKFVSGVEEALF